MSDVINLDDLTVGQLDELMNKARQKRREKTTSPTTIAGYVASVKVYLNRTLAAIHRLDVIPGVTDTHWGEILAELEKLSPERVKEEARKVPLPEKKARNRKKVEE